MGTSFILPRYLGDPEDCAFSASQRVFAIWDVVKACGPGGAQPVGTVITEGGDHEGDHLSLTGENLPRGNDQLGNRRAKRTNGVLSSAKLFRPEASDTASS